MNTNTTHTLRLLQYRDCLSADELNKYMKGTLPAQETQTIESHLLDCPLCSDALDGLMEHRVEAPLPDLHAARANANSSNKTRFWLAAASLLVAAALGSWLFYNFQQKPAEEQLALKNENASESISTPEVNPVPSSDAQVVTNDHTPTESISSPPKGKIEKADIAITHTTSDRVAKDIEGTTKEVAQTFSSDPAMAEQPTAVAEEKTTIAAVEKSQAAPVAARNAARTEVADAVSETAIEDLSIQEMFAREQYRAILDKFKNDHSQETLLYQGKSLYKLNRFKEALQTLQQVNAAPFLNESEWVSANCLMELGKTDKAKQIFEKISTSEGPHKMEAKAMSDKLK